MNNFFHRTTVEVHSKYNAIAKQEKTNKQT